MEMIKGISIGVFFLIILSGTAQAHKVNIFAYAENGMVHTESYFSDGRGAMNSTVEVFEVSSKRLLLTGKTDKNGEFSFKIPQATDLRILVTASGGHKNEYFLSGDEVRAALGRVKASGKLPSEKVEKNNNQTFPKMMIEIDSSQLEVLLTQVVEKETAPIMKKLLRMEEQMHKPTIQEVLGGIGYILGLMGIAIYFKYKLKR